MTCFFVYVWNWSGVTTCLFLVFFLALPYLCTMDRSTYVSSTMRWPTPTNASATLWQCTMAAGDSDFLKTFPLCYSLSKVLKVSCAFFAKQSCKKKRISRVGVFGLDNTKVCKVTVNATALKPWSCISMSHQTNCLEKDLEMWQKPTFSTRHQVARILICLSLNEKDVWSSVYSGRFFGSKNMQII